MAPLVLTAHDATGHVHLIVGSNALANTRCARSLEAGAQPLLITKADALVHYALQKKIDDGQVTHVRKEFEDSDLETLGREEVDHLVDAVFVTLDKRSTLSIEISARCRRLRIPVNVVDAPGLSSFTLLSTHSDGPLQIGITTSGKGCKMASRIRREIASSLPPGLGAAVDRLGSVRRRIWEQDQKAHDLADLAADNSDDDSTAQKATFNQLVTEADRDAAKTRRIRWFSQICEYWPLRKLVSVTDADLETILKAYSTGNGNDDPATTSHDHALPAVSRRKPLVILAGSGPGSPHLLTMATHRAIETASIILADKLVPAPVLELIPRRTPVHIARKFPGNADAAQEELLQLGLEALKKGMTVLRLKQGDPYIYGRGGEEYDFFRKHGFTPMVLPGITSSLSAPLFATIPATHRSVADQILICTGTGRKGAVPPPPIYVKTQTAVFLMALHRLSSLIGSLLGREQSANVTENERDQSKLSQTAWPSDTPCAVIERASCPDQRVIRSTLEHVVAAVEEEGSRPPGLLVVGKSCEVLAGTDGRRWVVEENFSGFDDLMGLIDDDLEVMTEAGKLPARTATAEGVQL